MLANSDERKHVRCKIFFFHCILVLWNLPGQLPSPPCSLQSHNFSAFLEQGHVDKGPWDYSYQYSKWWLHQKGFLEREFWALNTAQKKNFLDSQRWGGPLSVRVQESSRCRWHRTFLSLQLMKTGSFSLFASHILHVECFSLLPMLFHYHRHQDFG